MGDQQIYELGYLLKNDLENKALLSELGKISAEIVHNSEPKTIKLAYEIKKQNSAQFAYLHFKVSDAGKIRELNDSLNMLDDILRFIIIKLPSTKSTGKKKSTKAKIEKTEADFTSLSNEKLEEKLEEFVS
ncbi:MAG: 30S ribosomal protein S6 [bacterium]|nr:30S ribosomal protein S6 [bacterium]